MSVKLVVKAANIAIYRILLRPMEWLVRRFSSVGQHPFFDSSEFAWIPRLEAGWTTIRDELRALLRERGRIPNIQEISPEQLSLTRDDKWKSYWLCAFGRKIADNCRRCPETARLIKAIPAMESAFFSILASGKHLPEHRGIYSGVLRYHLGLVVPARKEVCRIRVDSEVAHWEEGRGFVFDDTYRHEVWNDTDEERVALIIDFARPLPFPLSVLNAAVNWMFGRSGYIQDIVENVQEWNRQTGPGTTGPSVTARTSGS